MTNRLFFFILVILPGMTISAQSLRHSFGENISVMFGTIHEDQYYRQDLTLIQSNLSYFPRVTFMESEKSSLSVGVPFGIGFGMYSQMDETSNDDGIYFSFDVPLVLDYNIGCNSSRENEDNFGGFFGVGFGYQKVSISQTESGDYDGGNYGPLVRGGIRFRGSSRWGSKSITISSFYKMGLEKEKLNTIGISAYFDL